MGILNDKIAVVTGAARGIGRATAIRFAEEGAKLAVVVRKEDENLTSLMQQFKEQQIEAKAYICNAADFERVHEIVKDIHNDFGRIDILVNNAGITKDGLMMRMTEEQWDQVININLKSAFNFVHAVTPIMMRQRSGSIVNMSSVVGIHGNAGQSNYAASKAGMIGLTKSIANELGSRGVRANAIAPGFIETDMTAALPEDVCKKWVGRLPLRRAGNAKDVADAALFLGSDLSSYVTGQVIVVDGGMNM